MARTEFDAIRELLGSRPRPASWAERRQRLDEVGSIWPIADDVRVEAVDLGGIPGEWSSVPLIQVGSDETLLADATRFASAAGAADVAVT
ncbi:MAG: hypothetical protein ACXWLI_12735, partial [Myxococcaceae bacterium]